MREREAVLALVRHARAEWYLVAQLLEITGGAERVVRGDWIGFEPPELRAAVADGAARDADLDEFEAQIAELAAEGISVVMVMDDEYPTNLRLIYNRPPFLFVRGSLASEDERAIAVVGTRQASEEGRALADSLARELASSGVTVLSGLALGIGLDGPRLASS